MKSFDRNVTKFIRMLHEMKVSVFEHLGITTCRVIDQMWMYVDQVLMVLALTNFRNAMLF